MLKQHIARNPTAKRGDGSEAKNADEIEMIDAVLFGLKSAADGARKHPGKVNHREDGRGVDRNRLQDHGQGSERSSLPIVRGPNEHRVLPCALARLRSDSF